MKFRNGFVTNSSSSSFIISVHGKDAHTKAVIDLLKFMCDEENYEYPQVIEGIKELGDVMAIKQKIDDDKFWGHYYLEQRIKNQDKSLLGKEFYDVTFSRGFEELREVLYDLLNTTNGIKIESTDSY